MNVGARAMWPTGKPVNFTRLIGTIVEVKPDGYVFEPDDPAGFGERFGVAPDEIEEVSCSPPREHYKCRSFVSVEPDGRARCIACGRDTHRRERLPRPDLTTLIAAADDLINAVDNGDHPTEPADALRMQLMPWRKP